MWCSESLMIRTLELKVYIMDIAILTFASKFFSIMFKISDSGHPQSDVLVIGRDKDHFAQGNLPRGTV